MARPHAMKLSDKFEARTNVVACQVADETVLLDTVNGSYFGLDPVGTRVWQLIEQGKALAEVCNVMFVEFDVPRDQLELDVMALVGDCLDRRLLVVAA
jgi:hypothetical protein